MLASIIYFVLFSAFIILLNKAEDGNNEFLSLENHTLQCVVRTLFVVLIIYSLAIPEFIGLDYSALDFIGRVTIFLCISLAFAIAGVIIGFIILGIINLMLWIFH